MGRPAGLQLVKKDGKEFLLKGRRTMGSDEGRDGDSDEYRSMGAQLFVAWETKSATFSKMLSRFF